MTFNPANFASKFSFIVVVLGVIILTQMGIHYSSLKLGLSVRQRSLKFILGLIMWLSFCWAIVLSGIVGRNLFPGIPLFFLTMNLAAIAFAFSSYGKQLSTLPLSFLIIFQAFRLPLELILHSWVGQQTIPVTMTWTGENLDILTGLLALVIAPIANKFKAVAWGFNVLGFILLLNVMRVAMLSSPLPFAWDVHPKLLLALYTPYFLIGAVCVAGALAGHIILTRALLKKE